MYSAGVLKVVRSTLGSVLYHRYISLKVSEVNFTKGSTVGFVVCCVSFLQLTDNKTDKRRKEYMILYIGV